MSTLHHDHNGERFIFIKGAPEQILEMCTYQRTPNGDQPLDKTYWLESIEALAKEGQRVLAIAFKPVDHDKMELEFDDVESDLIILGMLGLIDPHGKRL